jgi:hypothetical protein
MQLTKKQRGIWTIITIIASLAILATSLLPLFSAL